MKMRGRKIRNWDWPSIQAGAAVMLSAFLFLTENLSPFAPALLSAALCAGLHGGILLTFAAIGAVLSGQYWLMAGAAVCFLIHKLLKKPVSEVCAAIAAMLGALLCGALTAGLRLTSGLSAILACALAPSLVCGFQIRPGRHVLAPEEKLSLSLIWLLALAGLACSHPLGLMAARCLAALCAMAAARQYTAAGVSAGLLTGAACLCGAKFPVLLGAGAAAAGALRGLNRWLAAVGFLVGCCLAGYFLGALPWPILLAIAAGTILFCLLGEKRFPIMLLLTAAHANAADQRRLQQAQRSVQNMRLALSECAKVCADGGVPETASMVSLMRERLCDGCADYIRCWNGHRAEAGRLFSQLAARLDADHPPEELPPDQIRFCRRAPQIQRRLSGVYAAAEQRRAAQRERMLASQMSAAPIEKAAALLQELETGLTCSAREDEYGAEQAMGYLDRYGETVPGLSVAIGAEMAVEMCAPGVHWEGESLKRMAHLLSHALGGQYTARSASRFVQEPAIRVVAGVCSREAASGTPCGDQALCAPLDDGKTALILSDGMGRGAGAASESRCIVTLLHRLLQAGAQIRPAIDAVNSMMRLRSGEKFATLDLCIIDPYKGEAAFYKLGACLSVLLRRKVCLRVEGGQLPPGVVEPAEPSMSTLRLRNDDMIVMVTDGVADFAREGQEDWLTTTLATLPARSADTLAQDLIHAALKREKGKPGDDMTVLCARIIMKSHQK